MKELTFQNLDQTAAFKKLKMLPTGTIQPLHAAHIEKYDTVFTAGLRYNWAARLPSQLAPEEFLTHLAELAQEQQCIAKYRALLQGELMNPSEGRRVLHHLLRGDSESPVIEQGIDLGSYYRSQLKHISEFAVEIRNGSLRSPTGARYRSVVQIGIGGSELGPRALYRALHSCHERSAEQLTAYFISNIDLDQTQIILKQLDIDSTLFIVVSKSGTTLETARNEEYIIKYLRSAGRTNPQAQMVAVTSKASPLAANEHYIRRFFIDDYIGGRFSSSGAVGAVILSLCYGPQCFLQLLEGAHTADILALNSDPLHNPPLLDALLGVYERNITHYPAYAVIPYSDALQDFPAHIQQLDMESNGKSVNRYGERITYHTGSLIFGGVGTNVQHSFYQLLHQGSTIVPMIFIGFQESPASAPVDTEGRETHQEFQHLLNANLVAQIVAFARGETTEDPNHHFVGGRPSSVLYGQRLTPAALGALLSFFENRVMFQGFLWNINSFDQPGVQLGKKLANRLLALKETAASNESDRALLSYGALLGITQR